MEQYKPAQDPEVDTEAEPEVDFLADIEAADPESFNVCTACD